MNILVIYPRPDKFKRPRFGFSYEMMIISTILAKYHNISIKDYSCEKFDVCEFMKYLDSKNVDLVLVECDSYALKRSQNILHAAEIIDIVNKYAPTIAYGNYCYITKKDFSNATYTVIENDVNKIIDIVNQYVKSVCVPYVDAYDDIPFIDRNILLEISYYRDNNTNTLIQTAKGCKNTCIFCQRKGWQACYITHSDEYVLNEIRDIKNKGYRNIWITDENFTFNLVRAKRLLRKIIQEGLQHNLRFFISSWANIDEEFLNLAKQCNIRIISFGIESGNKEILKFYRKNINIDKVSSIIRYANSIGIFTVGNFIIGAPMETENTINETFELIKQCEFDQINIKNLDYMIGSTLYESLDEELKKEDHVFACQENGLNKFPLDEIKKIKCDFQTEYYNMHRTIIENKISLYGTPF